MLTFVSHDAIIYQEHTRVQYRGETLNMSASPVTLVGNLTSDPELKYLPNGQGKLEFGIAVNHYWTDTNDEKQERTSFFNIIVWRQAAEDAAAILEKGLRVIVNGRLEQNSWEDKDSGEKKSRIQLVADNVGVVVSGIESLERKQRSADGAKSASGQKPQPKKPQPKKVTQEITEEDEPF
jgi:single-strand DNA-binding protein